MRGRGTQLEEVSSSDFPSLLREIPDPPKQLFVRGKIPDYSAKWLTVVGSRAVTPYGERAVRHLIAGLRGYPIVIVSGLALGIDGIAHRAALDVSLRTVAMPGSGLDWSVLYPRTHVPLARDILAEGGALISEYKADAASAHWMFPRRNRIMAGISHATLVIEAQEQSGSLITARLAIEYNRDLLVVPGSIFSPTSAGVHQFLKLGATPVTSSRDVLRAFGYAPREQSSITRTDISSAEQRVLDLIAEPMSRAQLIDRLGMPITEANILLSTMEIKELMSEEFGVMRAL